MSISLVVAVGLVWGGVLLFSMSTVYKLAPALRNFPQPEPHLKGQRFWRRVVVTGLLSPVIAFGLTFILADQLVFTRPVPWWKMLGDVFLILFIYDFFYYFMHRYPFHQWKWMQKVHAVHHQSHRPIPIHAMHLHPVENFAGLGLLIFTIWLLGPVNIWSFAICFLVYSSLNILTHVGMDLKIPYLSMLSRDHDAHHKNMRSGNFSTLSPLPDIIFGTHEKS